MDAHNHMKLSAYQNIKYVHLHMAEEVWLIISQG